MFRTTADRVLHQLQLLGLFYKNTHTGNCVWELKLIRNYVRQAPRSRPEKTITPLEPEQGKRNIQDAQIFRSLDEMDPELREQIRNLEADDIEPNLSSIHLHMDEYEREKEALYRKTRRLSATRKYYKEFIDNEISLLTYAEKQKIKYLHENLGWTIEMIVDSFPITVTGADKLLSSKFRLHTDKEIMRHDQLLLQRLKRIEAGKMELDPDVEANLAKRSAQTLFIGAKWNPEECINGEGGFDMSVEEPKKELGEFESLVVIPPEKKEKKKKSESKQAMQQLEAQSTLPDSRTSETPTDASARKPKRKPKPKTTSFEDELEGVRDIRSVFPDFDGGEEEQRFLARLKQTKEHKRYTLEQFEQTFKSN